MALANHRKISNIILLTGLFFFCFVFSTLNVNTGLLYNFANDWIHTADLCGQSYKHIYDRKL